MYLSINTLKVNGLNSPIKRYRVAEWIRKQDPSMCCLQQTYFRSKDTERLKVKRWKKIYHANGNKEEAGVAILKPDKINFNTVCNKRQRRTLNNDKCINVTRGYYPSKHLCTQHRST